MNKLFLKIATLTAGVAMAIGVGVGLSSHKDGRSVSAATSTDNLTVAGFGGYTTGSFSTAGTDYTGSGSSGANYAMQVFNGSTGAVRGNQSSASSNFSVRNTSIKENSYISQIQIVRGSNTGTFSGSSTNSSGRSLVYFGTSAYANPNSSAPSGTGTYSIEDADGQTTLTWTNTDTTKTYFILYNLKTSGTVASCTVRVSWTDQAAQKVAPSEISCDDQSVIETSLLNLSSCVSFEPETTTEKGLSYTVKTGGEHISLNTTTGVVTGVSEGDAVVTITPTDTSGGATAIDVNIHVDALAITSIESSGTKKTDFVEEQALSYGTMTVKVNYNNETSQTLNMDAEGVSVKLGDEVITGARYLSLGDNGKTVTVSYAGFSFQYQIAVSAKEPVQEGYWTKITDAADFVENLEIIVVASSANYAMGTYNGTGNNVPAIEISKDGSGNIDTLVSGVQTYTLKSGDGETSVHSGTFALYDGTGYLYAAGGTGNNNHLKRTATINSTKVEQYSFTLSTSSINADFTGRSNMRFNTNNTLFSCYLSNASTTTYEVVYAYKFVAQEKPADQIAVENFCKESLHLDSSSPDYIDFNDHTSGTACVAYYSAAKTAYGELTPDQKDIFATSSEFIIARGRDRLSAWAEANKEEFDPTEGTFTPKANNSSYVVKSDDDNANAMMIVAIISSVAITGAAFTFILRKKKLSK